MSHECEDCGQECYCDMDDCGGLPQPNDCPHLRRHGQRDFDAEMGLYHDDEDDYE
jgi:hypothetical protein